jgi:hypothetical protein
VNRATAVIPIIIIVNACIWGFVMLMSSRALSGTGAYEQIQNLLAAGATTSLLVVGGGLGGLARKLKSSGSSPSG